MQTLGLASIRGSGSGASAASYKPSGNATGISTASGSGSLGSGTSNFSDFLPGGGFEGSTVDDDDDDDKKKTNPNQEPGNPDGSETKNNNAVPTPTSAPVINNTVISEHISDKTEMTFYANLHFAFENIRQKQALELPSNSSSPPSTNASPRVLLLGPRDCGKTSLCKTLVSYDCKRGRTPVVVNLDPVESVFCAPGALSATVLADILEIEQGWGGSAITGPALFHPKQPLVRFFGLDNPMKNVQYYGESISLLAKNVRERLDQDPIAAATGIYVDTPAELVAQENKELARSLVARIIADFAINVVLVVGADGSDLVDEIKKIVNTSATEQQQTPALDTTTPPIEETDPSKSTSADTTTENSSVTPSPSTITHKVTVVSVPKSGGAVIRSPEFLVSMQSRLINEYFYGTPKQPLSPYTITVDYSMLHIYRIAEDKLSDSGEVLSGDTAGAEFTANGSNDDDDDDYYEPFDESARAPVASTTSTTGVVTSSVPKKPKYLIKLEPSSIVENGLLAVVDASVDDSIDSIAKAAVRCFVHVVEADDNRRKMRILMPIHGRLPNKPFILGDFRYTE